MRRSYSPAGLFGLVTFFLIARAFGAPERNFGMGSAASGRVGAISAGTLNPFAADNNPAVMALAPRPAFGITVGGGYSRFQSPSGVLVDSPTYRVTEGKRERTGDYALERDGFSRWTLGLVYPFSLSHWVDRKAALGFSFSGPFNRLRNLVADTPYAFRPLRYGPSDEQFKGVISASAELVPDTLFFGAGLSLFITGAGAVDAVLLSENPTGRFEMDVGFNTALLLGLYARIEGTGVSLVYRQASSPTFTERITGRAHIENEAPTVDIPWALTATLYYEPHTIELDVERPIGPFSLSVGAVLELWSAYEPSFFLAEAERRGGGTDRTRVPELPMRNTLSPRIALSMRPASRLSVQAGYQLRPSPLTDEAITGQANLLDATTHVLGASAQYRFDSGWLFPFPLAVGAFAQWHLMGGRRVNKADGRFIGAPGYEIDGSAAYFGLSLEGTL